MSRRRQKEKEARRRLFVDVAEKLFLEKGFDGTTITDVARAAEFSKRAVYLYFNDKHELFCAVLQRGLQRLDKRVRGVLEPSRSGREQCIAILRAYAAMALEEPRFFQLMMLLEHRDYHYGRRLDDLGPNEQSCLQTLAGLSELFVDFLRRGQADGSLRSDLEPRQLNLMLWASLAGVLGIVISRRKILKESYGMSAEELTDATLLHLFSPDRQDGAP